MPSRGLGSARNRAVRRGILAAVVVLGVLVPVPPTVAQEFGNQVFVAPTCVRQGVATTIVITGRGWFDEEVTLSVENSAAPLGRVMARPSPFNQTKGSFTFTTSVTATSRFRIEARQTSLLARSGLIEPRPSCPEQISIKPSCLTGTGVARVEVSGSGFQRTSPLDVVADPFGNAERATASIRTDENGSYGVTIDVGITGATVPIVVDPSNEEGEHSVVAFLPPCPPPQTTAPTITRPPPTVSTTVPGTTTSTTVPGPGTPPPGEVPPVTIPTPDASVRVSISPFTVRPGRCVVLVVSAAPPGLAVVASFDGGRPVSAAAGSDGGVVLSLCHSHDSGVPLGPVRVLIGVGSAPPLPVFTVLRVPARPQPPMLQAGADGRRS